MSGQAAASRKGLVLRRVRAVLGRRTLVFGLAIIATLVLVAAFANLIAPYAADDFTDFVLQSPTWADPFGVDQLGRDVFSRVILGSRISLRFGVLAVSISLILGSMVGVVAGYFGGRFDSLAMRLMEVVMALPYVLLAVLIAAALGPSLENGIIVIGIVRIPRFARVARASTLSIRRSLFIEASRTVGASHARIIVVDVLPNILGPLLVYGTLSLGDAILSAAVLSFLGLGAQPPTPEWGAMLHDAQQYITDAPYLSIFPGLAIFLTVLAFNLVGDALRDVLDPTSRR
jgi:peptide/nickel transport system permease protein